MSIWGTIKKYLKGRAIIVVRETPMGNLRAEGTLKKVGWGYVVLSKMNRIEILPLDKKNFVSIMDKPKEQLVVKTPKLIEGIN